MPHILNFLLLLMLAAQSGFASTSQQNIQDTFSKFRNVSQPERAQLERFLRSNGIEPKLLLRGVFVRTCEMVLKHVGMKTSKDKFKEQFVVAKPHVQKFLAEAFTNGKPFQVSFVEAAKSTARSQVFREVGINEVSIPAEFKNVTGVDEAKLVQALKDVYKTQPSTPTVGLGLFSIVRNGDSLSVDFVVTSEFKHSIHFKLNDVGLKGQNPEQFVAEIIASVINHESILQSEQNFNKEVNMIAYDLKKLMRLTDASTAIRIKALADSIKNYEAGAFNNPTVMSEALLQYLNVKREVLVLGQTKAHELEVSIHNYRATHGRAPNLGYRPQFHKFDPDQVSIAGYRARGLRNNGYYINQRRLRNQNNQQQDGSQYLSTMAWMMDPMFMLTHPWYWGVRDNSFLAPFLFFQMIQNRDVNRPGPDLFSQQQPYDSRFFEKPVDPIYYQGKDNPVADPWNSQFRPDVIQPIVTDAGVTWQRLDGKSVIIDDRVLDTKWASFVGDQKSLWAPTADINPDQVQSGSQAIWVRNEKGELQIQERTLENPDEFTDPSSQDDTITREES